MVVGSTLYLPFDGACKSEFVTAFCFDCRDFRDVFLAEGKTYKVQDLIEEGVVKQEEFAAGVLTKADPYASWIEAEITRLESYLISRILHHFKIRKYRHWIKQRSYCKDLAVALTNRARDYYKDSLPRCMSCASQHVDMEGLEEQIESRRRLEQDKLLGNIRITRHTIPVVSVEACNSLWERSRVIPRGPERYGLDYFGTWQRYNTIVYYDQFGNQRGPII